MKWLIFALAVLLLIILILSIGLFVYACVRRKEKKDKNEVGASWQPFAKRVEEGKNWLNAHTAETVTLTTFDGLKIKSRVVPHENAKGTIVAMHGYRSRSDVDFAPECEFLWGLGYNLLVVMQRSHDESEGTFITFGVKERFDCRQWTEYAADRFGKESPIFLSGISMGSATVMMASELELPENVLGIIADCGYTSPWDIAKHVLRTSLHLPAFPVMTTANWIARLVAKFSFRDASPLEALRKNKLPVLFIHGGDDHFVPTEMSYRSYEACTAPKKLVIIEGAAHAQSYMTDTKTCQREIREFLECYNRRGVTTATRAAEV